MNPVLRKKLSILVHLAESDGEFAPKEKKYIKDISMRHGASNEEVNELIKHPEPIGSLGALSYPMMVEYMTDSLMLMLVDGKVLKPEILLCEDIGLRLGFTKNAVDKLINEIKASIDMSREELMLKVNALPHSSKP